MGNGGHTYYTCHSCYTCCSYAVTDVDGVDEGVDNSDIENRDDDLLCFGVGVNFDSPRFL